MKMRMKQKIHKRSYGVYPHSHTCTAYWLHNLLKFMSVREKERTKDRKNRAESKRERGNSNINCSSSTNTVTQNTHTNIKLKSSKTTKKDKKVIIYTYTHMQTHIHTKNDRWAVSTAQWLRYTVDWINLLKIWHIVWFHWRFCKDSMKSVLICYDKEREKEQQRMQQLSWKPPWWRLASSKIINHLHKAATSRREKNTYKL